MACDGHARRLGHRVLSASATPRAAAFKRALEQLDDLPTEVGELLYLLVLGRRARRVVAHGSDAAAIYLAAAIRDLGDGSVISTSAEALAAAGLADLVEVGPPVDVDLLFLGSAGPTAALRPLEPRLAGGALVVAMAADPAYRGHVAANGYSSIEVPLGAGIVLSARLRAPA